MFKKIFCLIFALLLLPIAAAPAAAEGGTVVAHNGNIQFEESTVYSLKVNGVSVPVRTELITGNPFHIAMFSFNGTAEIELTVLSAISKYKLAPTAHNITMNENGNTLSFSLDEPKTLEFEMTGEAPLLLLATPLETNIPDKNDPNVLYFEPGLHEAGVINAQSGQTIYLASGAVVIGRIQGVGVENVTVSGRGILDTEKYTTKPYAGMDDEALNKNVHSKMNQTKGIFFQDSQNCKVEGIGTRNCREWQTLYLGCKNFEISNLNIMGTKVNNDGIDLDTVEDFFVHNNFIMCGDDGFGWHTMRARDTKEEPTRNIKADNNTIYNVTAGNGIRFGSSMETNLWENIEITNTYILKAKGNAVMLDVQDWTWLKNVRIENVYVESSPSENIICVQIVKGKYSNDVELTYPYEKEDYRGHIENVVFKNVQSISGTGVVIGGYDETHLADNITLENINISGTAITDVSQIQVNPYVKNLTILSGGAENTNETFSGILNPNFNIYRGNWFTKGGVLKQSGKGGESLLLAGNQQLSDYTIACEITPGTAGQTIGLIGRMQDEAHYYYARLNTRSQKIELYKMENGTLHSLGSADYPTETGKTYALYLRMKGNAISCGIDGTELVSATDASYTKGKAGLRGYTWNRNQPDIFTVDNLSITVQ